MELRDATAQRRRRRRRQRALEAAQDEQQQEFNRRLSDKVRNAMMKNWSWFSLVVGEEPSCRSLAGQG